MGVEYQTRSEKRDFPQQESDYSAFVENTILHLRISGLFPLELPYRFVLDASLLDRRMFTEDTDIIGFSGLIRGDSMLGTLDLCSLPFFGFILGERVEPPR